MKTILSVLFFYLFSTAFSITSGQNAAPNTSTIWKDLSRLPHTLRDDISNAAWWKSTPGGQNASTRLDSMVKYSSFNNGKLLSLNKTTFSYPSSRETVQSDYVNYGEWVMMKRTTINRDGRNRIVTVLEEVPDQDKGIMTTGAKSSFFWHGESATLCDSILTETQDDQGQWTPSVRLYSNFDKAGMELSTETYKYDDNGQVTAVREENEYDQHGNVTSIRQFVAKNGQWVLLGKVQSTFDQMKHEVTRHEDIASGANQFVAIRKIQRQYDSKGNLVLEERYKWNEGKADWTPLKTINAGSDPKRGVSWEATESFTKGSQSYKTKDETFVRRTDSMTEKEVRSVYDPGAEKWRTTAELRYFYSK